MSGARSISDMVSPQSSIDGNKEEGKPVFYMVRFAVGRNLGCLRNCVACSKAYANLISVGSCQALEKNEMPTGRPKIYPAGTVIWGYPATAGGKVLFMSQLVESPLSRSITQAGPPDGPIRASSLCLPIAPS